VARRVLRAHLRQSLPATAAVRNPDRHARARRPSASAEKVAQAVARAHVHRGLQGLGGVRVDGFGPCNDGRAVPCTGVNVSVKAEFVDERRQLMRCRAEHLLRVLREECADVGREALAGAIYSCSRVARVFAVASAVMLSGEQHTDGDQRADERRDKKREAHRARGPTESDPRRACLTPFRHSQSHCQAMAGITTTLRSIILISREEVCNCKRCRSSVEEWRGRLRAAEGRRARPFRRGPARAAISRAVRPRRLTVKLLALDVLHMHVTVISHASLFSSLPGLRVH